MTGGYLYHRRPREPNRLARDEGFQDRLLEACAELTGVELPA